MDMEKVYQNAVNKLIEAKTAPNEARLEVNLLVEAVFGISKKDILINPSCAVSEEDLKRFDFLVKRRTEEHVPVQYLINRAEFMGEEFYVDENVLIPRPETELLVETVIKKAEENARILDIGTGSGCIAIMLAKNFSQVTASDISPQSLEVAKRNAKTLGVEDKITFIQSDIFENIEGKFDVIVSNPPYIAAKEREELQIEVTRHEPHLALFVDDEEGIGFYERLAEQASLHLNPGGFIAVEIGFSQAKAVKEIFLQNGFKNIQTLKDFAGIERVIVGTL